MAPTKKYQKGNILGSMGTTKFGMALQLWMRGLILRMKILTVL
ncbi:hypothetical protein CsSME_00003863 [Camellia sinensis var. sinensis]